MFLQLVEEEIEEERKAQEVEFNNLESLIYTFRRDDVVKQNRPLLDELNFLLEWVGGDGQSGSLDGTKSTIEEVDRMRIFFQSFHKYCEVIHRSL